MTAEAALAHIAAVLADIAPEADLAHVDRTENLREALDIDSMDFLRLIQGLHDRTGVDIPESAYLRVTTLDAMIAFLEAATPGAA